MSRSEPCFSAPSRAVFVSALPAHGQVQIPSPLQIHVFLWEKNKKSTVLVESRHAVQGTMHGIVLVSAAFMGTEGFFLRHASETFLVSPFSFAVPFPHPWDEEELAVAFCAGLYNDVLCLSRGHVPVRLMACFPLLIIQSSCWKRP